MPTHRLFSDRGVTEPLLIENILSEVSYYSTGVSDLNGAKASQAPSASSLTELFHNSVFSLLHSHSSVATPLHHSSGFASPAANKRRKMPLVEEIAAAVGEAQAVVECATKGSRLPPFAVCGVLPAALFAQGGAGDHTIDRDAPPVMDADGGGAYYASTASFLREAFSFGDCGDANRGVWITAVPPSQQHRHPPTIASPTGSRDAPAATADHRQSSNQQFLPSSYAMLDIRTTNQAVLGAMLRALSRIVVVGTAAECIEAIKALRRSVVAATAATDNVRGLAEVVALVLPASGELEADQETMAGTEAEIRRLMASLVPSSRVRVAALSNITSRTALEGAVREACWKSLPPKRLRSDLLPLNVYQWALYAECLIASPNSSGGAGDAASIVGETLARVGSRWGLAAYEFITAHGSGNGDQQYIINNNLVAPSSDDAADLEHAHREAKAVALDIFKQCCDSFGVSSSSASSVSVVGDSAAISANFYIEDLLSDLHASYNKRRQLGSSSRHQEAQRHVLALLEPHADALMRGNVQQHFGDFGEWLQTFSAVSGQFLGGPTAATSAAASNRDMTAKRSALLDVVLQWFLPNTAVVHNSFDERQRLLIARKEAIISEQADTISQLEATLEMMARESKTAEQRAAAYKANNSAAVAALAQMRRELDLFATELRRTEQLSCRRTITAQFLKSNDDDDDDNQETRNADDDDERERGWNTDDVRALFRSIGTKCQSWDALVSKALQQQQQSDGSGGVDVSSSVEMGAANASSSSAAHLPPKHQHHNVAGDLRRLRQETINKQQKARKQDTTSTANTSVSMSTYRTARPLFSADRDATANSFVGGGGGGGGGRVNTSTTSTTAPSSLDTSTAAAAALGGVGLVEGLNETIAPVPLMQVVAASTNAHHRHHHHHGSHPQQPQPQPQQPMTSAASPARHFVGSALSALAGVAAHGVPEAEHEALQQQLAAVRDERDVARARISAAHHKLQSSEEELCTMQQRARDAETSLDDLRSLFDATSKELKTTESHLQTARADLADREQRLSDCEHQLADTGNALRDVQGRHEQLQADNTALIEANQQQRGALSELEDERAVLLQTIREREAGEKLLRIELEMLSTKAQELEAEVEEGSEALERHTLNARHAVDNYEEKISSLLNRIDSDERVHQQLQSEFERRLGSCDDKIARLCDDVESYKQTTAEQAEQLRTAHTNVAAAEERVQTAELKSRRSAGKAHDLQEMYDRQSVQFESLSQQHREKAVQLTEALRDAAEVKQMRAWMSAFTDEQRRVGGTTQNGHSHYSRPRRIHSASPDGRTSRSRSGVAAGGGGATSSISPQRRLLAIGAHHRDRDRDLITLGLGGGGMADGRQQQQQQQQPVGLEQLVRDLDDPTTAADVVDGSSKSRGRSSVSPPIAYSGSGEPGGRQRQADGAEEEEQATKRPVTAPVVTAARSTSSPSVVQQPLAGGGVRRTKHRKTLQGQALPPPPTTSSTATTAAATESLRRPATTSSSVGRATAHNSNRVGAAASLHFAGSVPPVRRSVPRPFEPHQRKIDEIESICKSLMSLNSAEDDRNSSAAAELGIAVPSSVDASTVGRGDNADADGAATANSSMADHNRFY